MLEDSDRLLHTMDQVLRAGSSGSRLRRRMLTRVNLAEITRESVALARQRFRLSSEALSYDELAPVDETVVVGDGDELRAAVWNLLDNAVKYSPADDVRIEVRLERDAEGRVAVRVTDHGAGISRADLKRIFRRFYRVPTGVAVRAKGSGLGLSTVRSAARRRGRPPSAGGRGPRPRAPPPPPPPPPPPARGPPG